MDSRARLRSNGNKILFATMNVGAFAPQEYGDYFAWGETSKRYTNISGSSIVGCSFEWSNCPYHTGDADDTGFTKYIPTGRESYSESGVADNKLTLDAGDDVASVLWGGNWRMPHESDLEYLISDNVTYSWTDNYNGTGVAGLIVTGKGTEYVRPLLRLLGPARVSYSGIACAARSAFIRDKYEIPPARHLQGGIFVEHNIRLPGEVWIRRLIGFWIKWTALMCCQKIKASRLFYSARHSVWQ